MELGYTLAGRFRVDACIGEGGMGRVFAAQDLETGQPVVAKVLRREHAADRAHLARFHQEATLAASIRHPNVVRIHGLWVDAELGLPFIVMERIPGITLDWMIECDGPLPERRAAALFVQVAYALAAAHDREILHRDLKPSNVMITTDADGSENVRVVDFGLAKILTPGVGGLTAPGMFLGTPSYMAPEQVTDGAVTPRTDLYLLGCTLHAALTGERPYDGDDFVDVMKRQVTAPIPPLPSTISEPMRALHDALLAKHPDDRPSSALEVAERLDDLVSGPPSLTIPEAPTETGQNPVRAALASGAGIELDLDFDETIVEDDPPGPVDECHVDDCATEVGDLTPSRLKAIPPADTRPESSSRPPLGWSTRSWLHTLKST